MLFLFEKYKYLLYFFHDMENRRYIAIDLKSFYASAECVDRRLDPLRTHLVVADASRTEKTICLAVSPSLKAYGLPGRARLFEVVEAVRKLNAERRRLAPGRRFCGKSFDDKALRQDPALELDYVVATPRMARYLEVSARIYGIYLKYISPEDIHVYSIDEVFMDVTRYLRLYRKTARELAEMLIHEVLQETGITATAGIGTNLFLAKVTMDIVAKHIPANADGVCLAELNEEEYRRQLWGHRPLTDFWRIGRGYAEKLESFGMFTMGDICRMSLNHENLLYELFGVNAELLIDHAWGWEPCTLSAIKAYKPSSNSLSSGQVLQNAYDYDKARLVVREMADTLALELVEKHLLTDHVALAVGYDTENLSEPERRRRYHGPVFLDHYGRLVPKDVHGGVRLSSSTSSSKEIQQALTALFEQLVDSRLLIRRLNVVACRVVSEEQVALSAHSLFQPDLFTDYHALAEEKSAQEHRREREKRAQEAVISIRKKLGKNAILKGMNLEEGATGRMRNEQIGGHRA